MTVTDSDSGVEPTRAGTADVLRAILMASRL